MNCIFASGRVFARGSAFRLIFCAVLLFGSPIRMHLYATSLIVRANHKLVIAADCRVSRGIPPVSACKIIQEPGCTVAIAGLYEERNSEFHLREYIHAACQEPGDLGAKAEAFVRLARRPYEGAIRRMRESQPAVLPGGDAFLGGSVIHPRLGLGTYSVDSAALAFL